MTKEEKKESNAAYYQANKERLRANKAAYRKANPEKVHATISAWQKAYPEKSRAAASAWTAANPDKAKARTVAWRKANQKKMRATIIAWERANPEKVRESNANRSANRRARKRDAEGSHTAEEVKRLLARQKYLCVACRKSIDAGYHRDHIIPLAKGGSNFIRNIQLLCPTCNRKKSTKHPIKFMQEQGFLI